MLAIRLSAVFVALLALASLGLAAAREPWSAPKKTDSRSPCPMLNAMANHGYINKTGVNIALGDVIRVLESDTIGYPSMISFLHPMFVGLWVKFNPNKNVDLEAFDVFDHDASLTRQDFALTGHRGVDKELVAQLLAQANGKGYLDYDDLARARQLRYAQSKAANPKFHFSLIERFMAMLESIALMEVRALRFEQIFLKPHLIRVVQIIGENGRLPVDITRDFLLHERLPLKWKPHKWDISFYGVAFYRRLILFSIKTYTVGPHSHKTDEL
ncbi:hypothetical protein HK405_006324 [Cladochytrium tenue]|nr:hypothetical protein HK405_006324 [Cladochytrium tenue]